MMDERLYEAARTGDVATLDNLLKEDPLLLDKVCLSPSSETPLHVASLAGNLEFVRQIVRLMPSFAWEINQNGINPLHMAAARGHTELVAELVEALGSYVCLLKDKEGRGPLHFAAMKGRVSVIDKLLCECPHAIEQVTLFGETALHLAVKNSQFEAFRVLFQWSLKLGKNDELINAKDIEDKTMVDLAEATNQLQVINFLKPRGHPNNKGISTDANARPNTNRTQQRFRSKLWLSLRKFNKVWTKLQEGNVIPIMASLIATATYQAGISPPPVIWKDNMAFDTKCMPTSFRQMYSGRPLRYCSAYRFYDFMLWNTIGFVASVFLILFHRFQVIAVTLTCASLGSITWSCSNRCRPALISP